MHKISNHLFPLWLLLQSCYSVVFFYNSANEAVEVVLFFFGIQKIVDIAFFISNLAKGHRSIGHHFVYVVSVSYIKSSMKSLVQFKLTWLIQVSYQIWCQQHHLPSNMDTFAKAKKCMEMAKFIYLFNKLCD